MFIVKVRIRVSYYSIFTCLILYKEQIPAISTYFQNSPVFSNLSGFRVFPGRDPFIQQTLLYEEKGNIELKIINILINNRIKYSNKNYNKFIIIYITNIITERHCLLNSMVTFLKYTPKRDVLIHFNYPYKFLNLLFTN